MTRFTLHRSTALAVALFMIAAASAPALAAHNDHASNRGPSRSTNRGRSHQSRHLNSKSSVSLHFGSRHFIGAGFGYGNDHRSHSRHAALVVVRPGYFESRWVPPVTHTRYDDCGRPYTVVIHDGYYQKVWVAPTYARRHHRSHHYGHGGHSGHGSGVQVHANVRF